MNSRHLVWVPKNSFKERTLGIATEYPNLVSRCLLIDITFYLGTQGEWRYQIARATNESRKTHRLSDGRWIGPLGLKNPAKSSLPTAGLNFYSATRNQLRRFKLPHRVLHQIVASGFTLGSFMTAGKPPHPIRRKTAWKACFSRPASATFVLHFESAAWVLT